MIELCTVSDYNYLFKGLTLYESLTEFSDDFILNYLCIDDKSFDFLKKYESNTLKVWNINELLRNDKNLLNLKNTNYRYFCWSLASYFSNFLMKKNDKPIMYIDSDILLHDNINNILNEIDNKDIGIFRHRQFDLSSNRPEGHYNVGVVFFKNSDLGKFLLNWWSDAVLFMKYPTLATCGDQKYLEEFPKLCPKDRIFIDGNIGHGAPWQWQLFNFDDYEKDGTILWEGKKQKLIFSHFSQFDYDIDNDSYIPSQQHHMYTSLDMYKNINGLKNIYDDYFLKIKKTHQKYGTSIR
jgi:hypothetical protein